jgi:CBS domain-containing protein
MSAAEVDLSRVRVGDVIAPGIITCSPESTARDVAELMAAKAIHCVVVSDMPAERGARGWGVISDLDLASVAVGALDRVTAAEIAATEPVEVKATDSLEQASRQMVEHQVTHLLVAQGDPAQPIGVLSTLDLARALAGEAKPPPLVSTSGALEHLSEFAWVFVDVLGLQEAERRSWNAALHADYGYGPPFESMEALRSHLEAASEATEVRTSDVPIKLIALLITFFAAHPDRHEVSRKLLADALREAFTGAELPADIHYWLARHPGMVHGRSEN